MARKEAEHQNALGNLDSERAKMQVEYEKKISGLNSKIDDFN